MKIGIVFAGQGAQYEGMGKDLYDHYPIARSIFDEAGEQVKKWCFYSSKEVLRETHVTQPAVYTVTMAAYQALIEEISKEETLENKIEVVGFGGFSLGEYAALTAAGSISSVKHCTEIVSKRGQFMHEAGLDENGISKGGMVASFGTREKIKEIVESIEGDYILQIANYNSPKQMVVAGENEGINAFIEEAKERKIKVVPLSVGTAFHTEMMKSASVKIKPILEEANMKKPNILCFSNTTGRNIMEEFRDGDNVSEYLAEKMATQISKSVYWEEIVRKLIDMNVEAIIEVGPGGTLSSFTRKIDKNILTLKVENKESLDLTVKTLKEHCNN